MQYDVFICHASEDKNDFVRPLAKLLKDHHIEVWFDEFSLSIGDSLTEKIDEGLAKSRFGIVVLSPNFFKKPWAKRELSGLTFREMLENRNVILPIWHQVTVTEVAKFSLPLADKKASSSSEGINSILRELVKKIYPQGSPLIIARDSLANLNVETPPISDEWWLDVVEYKEFLKFPEINVGRRWIFPLPFRDNDFGENRGLNIANTALQLDWSFDGEAMNISPITHPDKVHKFLHKWPNLFDYAKENPGYLALYAPQLTIPGFDMGFEEVFDSLLESKPKDSDMIFTYGRHETIDDKEPLCGDIIALRHPTLGNYKSEELGRWYFDAHDGTYIRSKYSVFEGLIWLLSSDANWLPKKYHQTFVQGIKIGGSWAGYSIEFNNPFLYPLQTKKRKEFKLTRTVKSGLKSFIEQAIVNLDIKVNLEIIVKTFLDSNFIDAYYDYRDLIEMKRGNI